MNTIDDFDDDQRLVVSGNGLRVYPKGKIPASRDVPEGGFVTSVGNWKLKERLHKKRGNEKVGNAAGQVADLYLYELDNWPFHHSATGVDGKAQIFGESPVTHSPQNLMDGPARFHPDDPKHVIRTLRIKTTPEQDAKARTYIEQRMKNPGRYRFIGDSCVDAAKDVLNSGGVKTPKDNSPRPSKFFDQVKELNGFKAQEYKGYVAPKK